MARIYDYIASQVARHMTCFGSRSEWGHELCSCWGPFRDEGSDPVPRRTSGDDVGTGDVGFWSTLSDVAPSGQVSVEDGKKCGSI